VKQFLNFQLLLHPHFSQQIFSLHINGKPFLTIEHSTSKHLFQKVKTETKKISVNTKCNTS